MPRNMLFLMTDQHRIDTLGCYGNPRAQTPNLDALAAEGTRFGNFFTPTAICTPARASLLTGYAPFRHKLLANYERNVGYLEDLSPGQFTFAERLTERGYNLGLLGKWHGGVQRSAADYGFQGPDLQGWHNPVDHPDYLSYLDEHGLPPYSIRDEVRGTAPKRQSREPAGRAAGPAGGGDFRALPGHPDHRAAATVRRAGIPRGQAVLPRHALLRAAPAVPAAG